MIGKRLTTEEFIKRAKEIHGDKYDYNETLYTNWNTKVQVICLEHGIITTSPCIVLRKTGGGGCKKCHFKYKAGKYHKISVDIIKERILKRIENTHFSFDLSQIKEDYHIKDYVYINCSLHGKFKATLSNFVDQKRGCPKCKTIQSSYVRGNKNINIQNIKCNLYILKLYNEKECFYKVGISTNIKHRVSAIKSKVKNKYNIDILFQENLLLTDAVNLESKILNDFCVFKYKPKIYFDGQSECLKHNPLDYYYEKQNKNIYETEFIEY